MSVGVSWIGCVSNGGRPARDEDLNLIGAVLDRLVAIDDWQLGDEHLIRGWTDSE